MTSPTDPTRDPAGPPAVGEVAALTARLWGLSTRARAVDPAERAAFLADRDALIDRVVAATADAPVPAWLDRRATLERLAEPSRPDDPAEIATRLAALREKLHAETNRVAWGAAPDHSASSAEHAAARVPEPDRHEHLARWHADDHPADTDGAPTDAVGEGAPAAVREW